MRGCLLDSITGRILIHQAYTLKAYLFLNASRFDEAADIGTGFSIKIRFPRKYI